MAIKTMASISQSLLQDMRKRGYIAVKDAAKAVARPEVTIRFWCRKGLVRAIHSGSNWFVNKTSLFERAGIT
jgi:hypothetical protein